METFNTTAPITAILDIPAGRIRFTAGEQTTTTVEVRPSDPSKGRDVTSAEQITVAYADGVLRIAGVRRRDGTAAGRLAGRGQGGRR
jgi:hypothetical protein